MTLHGHARQTHAREGAFQPPAWTKSRKSRQEEP